MNTTSIYNNQMLTLFLFIVILFSGSNLNGGYQLTSKVYQEQSLYPMTKPFNEGFLNVSEEHTIYFAEFGNPEGIPVVTIHGGPGSQCYSSWTAFFDPSIYHVIMFDQRGAGRSTPFAEMRENTPQNSVNDMEKLRVYLGIDKWILYGGSYGSFLAILYGETHPEKSLGFVLRGICLGSESEYKHLFYGMQNTYPEAWDEMVADIPKSERYDLITAFHTRVMDPNPAIHLPAARAFMRFDTLCATLLPDQAIIEDVDINYISTLGIARAFIHYSANGFFVEEKQILNNLSRITHLPAIIVQGRYDIICPPKSAYELYKNWSNSKLWFVSDAGHATKEVGISQALREAMDDIAKQISN